MSDTGKESYASFFEHAPVPVLLVDEADKILSANRQFHLISGYTPDELKHVSIDQLLGDEIRTGPTTAGTGRASAKAICSSVLYHKDGQTLPVEISTERILWENQRATCCILSPVKPVQDISKKVVNDSLFRAVTNSTRDAIIMIDGKGCISFWNPAAEHILGYTSAEVIGKNLHAMMAPERFHTQHQKAFLRFQQTGKGMAIDNTLELEALHKDGHEISIELSLSTIILQEHIHALGIIRDITDRKRAEEELRKSEERYRALHNASFGGIGIHDHGVILDCNQGLTEISGYTKEELVGMNGLLLIAEQARETVMANIMAGYEKPYETVGCRKDGSEFPLRIEARNIPHKDKVVRVVEFRDITDQVRMREEQELLQNQLLQSQKVESIGRLAGGVAHDLNNLLSPILGYSELLMDNLDFSEAHRKKLGIILDAAHRSRELVRQLLAFSRKQTLEVKPIDINRVVENLKKLLQRIIPEDVIIELDLSTDACITPADINQIEQVLVNLSVNAADAMPEGGTLNIRTAVVDITPDTVKPEFDNEPGRYVLLSVSDTGKGIAEDILQEIFEPFFSTKGELGTGLGLATVYGIIKQHGGSIEVTSEPDRGSRFRVYLPYSDLDYFGEEDAVPKETSLLSKGSGSILIVEDNEHVRQLAATILQIQGYNVLVAENGTEALAKCEQFEDGIDLLLTDVILPGMNGRTLSEKMTAMLPDLKTLYMSGYPAQVMNSKAIREKGAHFIQKPFTRAALTEKIREILKN